MNPNKTKKADYSKLDPEFLQVLKTIEDSSPQAKALAIQAHTAQVLQVLGQEIINSKDDTAVYMEKMDTILSETQNALKTLENKPDVEIPGNDDVVSAIQDNFKQIADAIKAIDVKPEVTVEAPEAITVPAPEVNVAAPNVEVNVPVDKITKLLDIKLPKLIQQVVDGIPETDNSDLKSVIEATNELLEKEFAKPKLTPQFPSSMTISNLGDIPSVTVYSKATDAYSLSNIDDSTSTEYYGYENADGAWYIKRLISNAITFAKGNSDYSTAWSNRSNGTHTYASYGATF